MTAVAAPAPPAGAASEGERLTRSTATISAFTLVSRLTGFVRIFVLAAVVGTTYLGNTYQAANSVPNLVFELFAAGALQAVLVPELIGVAARTGRAAGRQLASVVLGGLLAAFGLVVVIGAVVAPLASRLLFAGAPDGVRADQVWLGTVFLWVFLPQVVFYAGGLVATAVLNADDHFAVPAVAPALNNLVVVAAYLGFWWMRGGGPPSLHLSPAEVAVLAGGTTLGVIVFTSAPVASAARRGLLHRPRLALRDRDLRRLARRGAWAGAFLGLIQVLLVVALALGNTVEGGGAIYQLGFTYFLLPHALVAVPVLTALYPAMSRATAGGDEAGFMALVRSGTQATWVLALPAVAAMVVLAEPIARLTLLGESARSVDAVAGTIVAFSVGLAPYGLFLLFTRVSYARGDVRSPTVVHLVGAVVGVAVMAVATALWSGDARIAGLAAGHSAAYVVACLALGYRLWLDLGRRPLAPPRVAAGALAAALAAGAAMLAVRLAGPGGSTRTVAALQLAAGGAAGVVVYLAGLRLAGAPDPRRLLHPQPAGEPGRPAAGADGGPVDAPAEKGRSDG
jgi:putative peptidoglycan lipid II flippase